MIYHLLDQVAELMAGSAPRVEEEVVVGEAQVLQTFALKKGARCVDLFLHGCSLDGFLIQTACYNNIGHGKLDHRLEPPPNFRSHCQGHELLLSSTEAGDSQRGDVCRTASRVIPA